MDYELCNFFGMTTINSCNENEFKQKYNLSLFDANEIKKLCQNVPNIYGIQNTNTYDACKTLFDDKKLDLHEISKKSLELSKEDIIIPREINEIINDYNPQPKLNLRNYEIPIKEENELNKFKTYLKKIELNFDDFELIDIINLFFELEKDFLKRFNTFIPEIYIHYIVQKMHEILLDRENKYLIFDDSNFIPGKYTKKILELLDLPIHNSYLLSKIIRGEMNVPELVEKYQLEYPNDKNPIHFYADFLEQLFKKQEVKIFLDHHIIDTININKILDYINKSSSIEHTTPFYVNVQEVSNDELNSKLDYIIRKLNVK
jgi:hypothetical protein